MQKKLDPKKLRDWIQESYHGPIKEEKAGIKIRCPWHQPDNNPSCIVFVPTGIFYCVVCHGDQPKGKRGLSPYRGFQAIGMSEQRARRLFIDGEDGGGQLSFQRLPNLLNEDIEIPKKIFYEKVSVRDPWPKDWSYRAIDAATMSSPWFRKRFDPCKVVLKKEHTPRLALAVGGCEQSKPTDILDHPNYLRHEVFLRLSSAVKVKAVNSHGLTLDPDVLDPLPATLFGLVNNRLSKGSSGLFLTEGPYDAIRLQQHLHRPELNGRRFDCAALLGTPQWRNCLSQLQTHILPDMARKGIPVILAFDNDMAGFKLTATAIKDLKSLCYFSQSMIHIFDYPHDIKDPGDTSFDVFLQSMAKLGLTNPIL